MAQEIGPDNAGAVVSSFDLPFQAGAYDEYLVVARVVDRNGDTNIKDTVESTFKSCQGTTGSGDNPGEFKRGCARVSQATRPLQPVLSTAWESMGTTSQNLVVTVTSQGPQADARFSIWAVGSPVAAESTSSSTDVLYSARLVPDANGKLDATVKIPVGNSYSTVCVGVLAIYPHWNLGAPDFPTLCRKGDAGIDAEATPMAATNPVAAGSVTAPSPTVTAQPTLPGWVIVQVPKQTTATATPATSTGP